jgi:LmbE family N-acetylglucosaminyl deacetylase
MRLAVVVVIITPSRGRLDDNILRGKMQKMKWVYLSPHLDDAIYSCGGLIWAQTQAGQQVEVWTICAGDPPPGALSPFAEALHARWEIGEEAGKTRREEDEAAASYLGADICHLTLPDCIYRRHPVSGEALYASEEAIFGELHPAEEGVVNWLASLLVEQIPTETVVVAPLALGGHVDHRLVRAAAEQAGCVDRYYADYPYAVRSEGKVEEHVLPGWDVEFFPVSDPGFQAWEEAIARYASQLSTFWLDQTAMAEALRKFVQVSGGIRLWRLES